MKTAEEIAREIMNSIPNVRPEPSITQGKIAEALTAEYERGKAGGAAEIERLKPFEEAAKYWKAAYDGIKAAAAVPSNEHHLDKYISHMRNHFDDVGWSLKPNLRARARAEKGGG